MSTQQQAFEAWMKVDTTLPLTRDAHGYSDFTTALMWHTWQAAQEANAPGGALVGEPDANAGPGLAGSDSACKHNFALHPPSGMQLCQLCGRSTVGLRTSTADRTRGQRMQDAGFTRRPSAKSLPSDE